MRKALDLTNQRFGRLVVLKRASNRNKEVFWLCRCDCGTEKEIRRNSLIQGITSSCGCFYREQWIKGTVKHRMSGTKEYKATREMIRREKKKLFDSEWSLDMKVSIKKFLGVCAICGMTEVEHLNKYKQSLHIDHVLPLSKCFGLKPGNVVILCKHHNVSKLNKNLNKLPMEDAIKIKHSAEHFYCYWNTVVNHLSLGDN